MMRGSSIRPPLPLHPGEAHHTVVRLNVDDADAPCVAALRRHVLGREADQLAFRRHEEDVVGVLHLDEANHEPVPPASLDVDDSLAPRPWSRYSASGVCLPYPRSVTVRIAAPSWTTSAAMTASSASTSMPLTPAAARPIGRTSSSLKRMARPCRVPRRTSRWPSVRRTAMTSSPSSRVIARIPPRCGREYAASSVFFTRPWRDAKKI